MAAMTIYLVEMWADYPATATEPAHRWDGGSFTTCDQEEAEDVYVDHLMSDPWCRARTLKGPSCNDEETLQ
jgi:hypothetical protein